MLEFVISQLAGLLPVVVDHGHAQQAGIEVARALTPRLARGGAIDKPNYVSLRVHPDGLGVQINGIARPGDSAYPQR